MEHKTAIRNGTTLFFNETVVYERGEWGLVYEEENEGREVQYGTYATHKCKDLDGSSLLENHYGEYCWVDEGENTPYCNCCDTPVPEDIITLVRISNWKR